VPGAQKIEDGGLEAVGVLVLVDEHVQKPLRVFAQCVGLVPQQRQPVREQVVEIHQVEGPFPFSVGPGDVADVLGQGAEVRKLPPDDLFEGSQGVDGEPDDGSEDVPFGKSAPFRLDAGICDARVQQRLCVVGVHDGIVAPISQPVAVASEHPVRDVVEGAPPEPADVHARQKLHTAQHLPGGLVREGGQENPFRRRSRLDEAGHAVGKRPRLAAAGTRDDQHRSAFGRDDPVLLGVEISPVIDRQRLPPAGPVFYALFTRFANKKIPLHPPFSKGDEGGSRLSPFAFSLLSTPSSPPPPCRRSKAR